MGRAHLSVCHANAEVSSTASHGLNTCVHVYRVEWGGDGSILEVGISIRNARQATIRYITRGRANEETGARTINRNRREGVRVAPSHDNPHIPTRIFCFQLSSKAQDT